VSLFPDWSDERFPLYTYYASRSYVSATIRTFIDFIVESLGAEAGVASNRRFPKSDARTTLEVTGVS
jgi:hypothetical protein